MVQDQSAMMLIQAVVLGVVQGLTEFLPISSTAHLRVVPAVLGWQDPGTAYSAVIQLGSVAAVLTYFFKDLLAITTGSISALKDKNYGDQNLRLAGGIILGTIPICVLGLGLKSLLEQDGSPLRSMTVIGAASIFMGLMLLVAEKKGTHARGLENMGAKDGLIVGIGQAMALIPGCSRSGSTLTFAMFLGLKRADAARFSFLLGIPAIILSGLLELKHLKEAGLAGDGLTSLIVGLVTSAVVSYIAIAWLLKFLQTHSTWVFIIYRLIFGASVLAMGLSSIAK